jgi:hypothetical protein
MEGEPLRVEEVEIRARIRAPGTPPGNSSRPYGTFRLLNLYPGLRPGLRSATFSRPYGTRFRDGRSHADT